MKFEKSREEIFVELDDIGYSQGMTEENIKKFTMNVWERHNENPFESHDSYYGYVDGVAQKYYN